MDVGPALAAVRAAPTLLEAMREARVLATVTA